MRHKKKTEHLKRKSSHRKAMLSNMATSLIMHKRITTTVPKAKALRKYVEPLITKAKDDSLHSRRIVFRYLQNKFAVSELFREVSPKIISRPGGYTRILKTGNRLGDNAEMCIIELVDYNENMLTVKETKAQEKAGKSRRRRSKKKSTTEEAATVTQTNEQTRETSEPKEDNTSGQTQVKSEQQADTRPQETKHEKENQQEVKQQEETKEESKDQPKDQDQKEEKKPQSSGEETKKEETKEKKNPENKQPRNKKEETEHKEEQEKKEDDKSEDDKK